MHSGRSIGGNSGGVFLTWNPSSLAWRNVGLKGPQADIEGCDRNLACSEGLPRGRHRLEDQAVSDKCPLHRLKIAKSDRSGEYSTIPREILQTSVSALVPLVVSI